MNPQESPLNIAGYLKYMTRKERYEWNNYESSPLEQLEAMTEVVGRGLQADEIDRPGVEKDLIALELISDEAQRIINKSRLAGITAGLLGLVGGSLLVSSGGQEFSNLFYPQVLCIGLPAIAIASGVVGQALSHQHVFGPMANRFINRKVQF